VATLSRASLPFWNGCFLRSYSFPSSTKTIPHLARTACFIIILLITFVMIRRLITAYFVTATLFARSSSYLADNTWRPQHCMSVQVQQLWLAQRSFFVFEGCLRAPPTFSTSTFPCLRAVRHPLYLICQSSVACIEEDLSARCIRRSRSWSLLQFLTFCPLPLAGLDAPVVDIPDISIILTLWFTSPHIPHCYSPRYHVSLSLFLHALSLSILRQASCRY